jgi:hypothetical protein
MPRSSWGNKSQQRQIDSIHNNLAQVIKVGRMATVPLADLSATSDLKTRGAQVSFNVVSLEGIDHFVLLRNFSRDIGSAVAINTWPALSLKKTPQTFPLALHYADADPSISQKIAYYWIKAVPASTRTQDNEFVSGPQQFDASNFPSAAQITGDYAVTQSYTPTTLPLSSSTGAGVNQATVTIAPFQIQYPFDANGDGVPDLVSYNGGAVTPLNDSTTYYIYFDDPTYAGGTQTFLATLNNPDVTGALHRQYMGSIITPAHGGGGTTGGGGGGGACFSGNTLVITKRGVIAIAGIRPGDWVYSRMGWKKVGTLLVHAYKGEMLHMGQGELVTPGHRLYEKGKWVPASEIYKIADEFEGEVFNLSLSTKSERDDGRCYLLANGRHAHNQQKR